MLSRQIRAFAVDPGWVNNAHFGSLFTSTCEGLRHHPRDLIWENQRLVKGTYRLSKARKGIDALLEFYSDFIRDCTVFAVETQMTLRLQNIQNYFTKKALEINPSICVVLVNPNKIKKKFGISMKHYRRNKRAAVDLVGSTVGFPRSYKGRKQDDLADVLLLAYTAVSQYLRDNPNHGKRLGADGAADSDDAPSGLPDPVNTTPYFLLIDYISKAQFGLPANEQPGGYGRESETGFR